MVVYVGFEINVVWQLLIEVYDFVYVFGNQVMVFYWLYGQVNVCYMVYFVCLQIVVVNDVFCIDCVFGGDNVLVVIGVLCYIGGVIVGEILGIMCFGCFGKCVGGVGWIQMIILCVLQDCVIVVGINQWVMFGQFFG